MTSSLRSGRRRLLRVARQRETEIGIQRALVKFVEQHRSNAFERWIVDHKARENAFGHHLDPRSLGDPRAEPHAQTDGVADLLAEGRRHAGGRSARGEPARLQDENLLILCP